MPRTFDFGKCRSDASRRKVRSKGWGELHGVTHCCWLSESDTLCKCDTDVWFLSIPATIFSLGKLLIFYILWVFLALLESMETTVTFPAYLLLSSPSPPSLPPSLPIFHLRIWCTVVNMQDSALLEVWKALQGTFFVGYLMDSAHVVCKNLWYCCES